MLTAKGKMLCVWWSSNSVLGYSSRSHETVSRSTCSWSNDTLWPQPGPWDLVLNVEPCSFLKPLCPFSFHYRSSRWIRPCPRMENWTTNQNLQFSLSPCTVLPVPKHHLSLLPQKTNPTPVCRAHFSVPQLSWVEWSAVNFVLHLLFSVPVRLYGGRWWADLPVPWPLRWKHGSTWSVLHSRISERYGTWQQGIGKRLSCFWLASRYLSSAFPVPFGVSPLRISLLLFSRRYFRIWCHRCGTVVSHPGWYFVQHLGLKWVLLR